ncbi:ABCB family ABC transporter ATP-binding protein/permease [Peredibacter starrii]|uniref:ABC transporter ATP-binding protein/permease n=1 Tax=Peredibacter starrii TaxID=28202 RepID=A0AAX4HV15_9BACT|nr:ABC transporter ATP-binding protein/permease [Peredibacter starrii]WPU66789.1 ABC transporter ATP-binding protein/permease [Peredibacter starrii]
MSDTTSFSATSETIERNHWKTLKTLGHYLWPADRKDLKVRVVFAMFFLAAGKILNVYVPFLLKSSIDQLSQTNKVLVLPLGLIIAYGLARLLVGIFEELRDLIFAKVEQHALRNIALNTFRHLHGLSLDFHLSRQTGGLSRVIERGTRGIQFLLDFMTFNIIPTILEIILVTGVLVYHFNLTYASVIFITIAIYIVLTLMVTEWRLKYRKAMNTAETKANTRAIDSLLNFETVKYFGNEEHEFHRFDESLAQYETAAIKGQNTLSLLNLTQKGIISFGLIIIMLMAARDVVSGKITVGDFVLVNTFLIQLYLPLNFLGFVYREIKNSLVDMDKMFELIKVHASVADDSNAEPLVITRAVIEFEDVRFGYKSDREILKGISFRIDSGKTLAIVGPSGSGKSTIGRLLYRFYDVTGGVISIDGQNIRKVKQHSLRSHIGMVPQDTVLFNDTIGYNIQYGRPTATMDEVKRAAELAHIDEFINELPDRYETPVGERGLKLSGGEKQRVAIARTILKNSEILLFDEATSALDSQKEKEIQKSLKDISRDRSTLIIAHRLSTITHADEIIVLQNGKVVERGVHSQLLRQGGIYASMWAKQQEEEAHSIQV